jgi:hypothetical protein
MMRISALTLLAGLFVALPITAVAQWKVETQQGVTRAMLPEFGGRATLVIQCVTAQSAEPVLFVHEPVNGTHQLVIYRFDEDEPKSIAAPVSQDGHLLHIWNDEEKENFSRSHRLRVQLRPFVVLDFALSGIDTIAAKINC